MSAAMPVATNPYVGPRTFTYAERKYFFGREREARDLAARIVSERLLLFYAQSGAGKSSLLNARVIPQLREDEGFAVLPVGRVSGDLPAGVDAVDNIYLFNLMVSIDQSDPRRLAHVNLGDFLGHLASDDGESWRYDPDATPAEPVAGLRFLLIVDQFEEIITAHPERWQERSEFFRQLNQVLRAQRDLWVLLTLREDYVASLDPYAPLVDGKLQARFYMERMGVNGALAAVREPARLAGRPFAPGVAEQLVDDLRHVQVGSAGPDGALPVMAPGDYVEPVQLQIVCFGLWNRLPPDKGPIRMADYQAFGNVDQALTNFYEHALLQVSQGAGVSERQLRTWFDTQLITPANTRGLAYRSAEATAGLPNAAVDQLANLYLIRAEVRSGNRYYELAHDRLVEPVQTANRHWLEAYDNPLVIPTRNWLSAQRDPARLLDGLQLEQARTYAGANPRELLAEEREFLAESERGEAERRADAAARAQRRRVLTVTGAVVTAILAALTAWAIYNAQVADAARHEADIQRQEAEAQRNEAVRQAAIAKAQADVSRSRELAAAAVANLDVDPELSILLAQQAHVITYTLEAESALRQALQTSRIMARYPLSGDGEALAYSPDGQRLAIASAAAIQVWDLAAAANGGAPSVTIALPDVDPTARVDDVADAAEQAPIDPNAIIITAAPGETPEQPAASAALLDMAFSPDGTLLATAHNDGATRLWDARTGAEVRSFGRPRRSDPAASAAALLPVMVDARSTALAFSPDNIHLAASYLDGTVRIWNIQTGSEAPVTTIRVNRRGVLDVAYSPDGTRLATAAVDNRVDLWDAATGDAIALPAPEHTAAVYAVAFSPDGRKLASGSVDKTVIIWDVGDAAIEPSSIIRSPTNTVTDVAFSPDGACLAYASLNRNVRVEPVKSGLGAAEPLALQGHTAGVRRIEFRPAPDEPDNRTGMTTACGLELASVAFDGTARRWNIGPTAEKLTIAGHGGPVESVAYSPDGAQIAASSDDGAVKLWDAHTGAPVRSFDGHFDRANGVAFSPDGQRLASAGFDNVVIVWNVATGEAEQELTEQAASIQAVAFSPDGAYLAAGSDDKTTLLYDGATFQVSEFFPHDAAVYGIAFSPDSKLLVSTGADGLIKLWPVGALAETPALTLTHGGVIQDAAFTPDGERIASISWDSTVRQWRAADGAPIDTLRGHTDRVYGVAYAPDASLLATSSADRTVRLWDPQTGAVKHLLFGPEFNGLAFSPDGRELAVGGEDATIRVYVLASDDLRTLAAGRVTRSMTPEECQQYLQVAACP